MALLQISETGQAPDPHQRRIAVGIDLGTTHSLVASVRNGVAECLPDEKGQVILPSVVRYLPGQGRQIGHEAVANAAQDPENTLASVKRFMGRSLSDIANSEKLPYKFVKPEGNAPKGMLSIQTVQGVKSPVEVSAEILATLRYRAEDTFNDDLHGAVITVPAYFIDTQLQSTRDAGKLAGLDVLRIINEPTAAALAYGVDKGDEATILVYELGEGTFDLDIFKSKLSDIDLPDELKDSLTSKFSSAADDSDAIQKAMDMDFFVSFGPVMIYANDKQTLLSKTDQSKILVETDGPVRFSRCFEMKSGQISFIPSVIFCASKILEKTFDEMSFLLEDNTKRFLGI